MNLSRDSDDTFNGFATRLEAALREQPAIGKQPAHARAPGVVDVMGGIGEDAGSLVLTATTGVSHMAAVWPVAGDSVHLTIVSSVGDEDDVDLTLPLRELLSEDAAALRSRCAGGAASADYVVAPLLAIKRLITDAIVKAPQTGLAILIDHDFPQDADLGRLPSIVIAVAEAFCRLNGTAADRSAVARCAAAVVREMIDLDQLRKTMTALIAPPGGALVQIQFHPELRAEQLDLPQGVIIKALSTRLSRPTTIRRLVETRLCSEMGHRVILTLQQQDGQPADAARDRLSAITPVEFVEKFRDRMPSRITHQQFVTKFGAVRGLPETPADPKGAFKIRSRAEHHIYECRRVHDFARHIVRGRRNGSADALTEAGDLMYASHWSHSQRCGIGGVETDRLVTLIREAGPAQGLYGAKITSGGEGGELVVLMRGDARAETALAEAATKAEALSKQPVRIHNGSLPGALHAAAQSVTESAGAV